MWRPSAAETCAGGRVASLGGTDCCGYSTCAMVGLVGHLENVGPNHQLLIQRFLKVGDAGRESYILVAII